MRRLSKILILGICLSGCAADSQDAELATRLAQAAVRPTGEERQSFRDYLHQRETSRAQVQS